MLSLSIHGFASHSSMQKVCKSPISIRVNLHQETGIFVCGSLLFLLHRATHKVAEHHDNFSNCICPNIALCRGKVGSMKLCKLDTKITKNSGHYILLARPRAANALHSEQKNVGIITTIVDTLLARLHGSTCTPLRSISL